MRLFSFTCVLGEGESEIKSKTLGEFIKNLCETKGAEFRKSLLEPETGKISSAYVILVNGKPIDRAHELSMKIKKGDTIAILPDLGGG